MACSDFFLSRTCTLLCIQCIYLYKCLYIKHIIYVVEANVDIPRCINVVCVYGPVVHSIYMIIGTYILVARKRSCLWKMHIHTYICMHRLQVMYACIELYMCNRK